MDYTYLISYFYLVGYRNGIQKAYDLVEARMNGDLLSTPDAKVGPAIALARPTTPTTSPTTRVPASPVV